MASSTLYVLAPNPYVNCACKWNRYAAGLFSEFFIYPLDTIRRRQQVLAPPKARVYMMLSLLSCLLYLWLMSFDASPLRTPSATVFLLPAPLFRCACFDFRLIDPLFWGSVCAV